VFCNEDVRFKVIYGSISYLNANMWKPIYIYIDKKMTSEQRFCSSVMWLHIIGWLKPNILKQSSDLIFQSSNIEMSTKNTSWTSQSLICVATQTRNDLLVLVINIFIQNFNLL
jgi:hypothetical protein